MRADNIRAAHRNNTLILIWLVRHMCAILLLAVKEPQAKICIFYSHGSKETLQMVLNTLFLMISSDINSSLGVLRHILSPYSNLWAVVRVCLSMRQITDSLLVYASYRVPLSNFARTFICD